MERFKRIDDAREFFRMLNRYSISVTNTSVFALSSFLCFSFVIHCRDYNCVSYITLAFASRFLFAFSRDSGSLRLGILFFRFFQLESTLQIVKYFKSINSLYRHHLSFFLGVSFLLRSTQLFAFVIIKIQGH